MDFYCYSCGKHHPGEPARVTPGGGKQCARCNERGAAARAQKHNRRKALRRVTRTLRSDYIDFLSRI